MPPGDHLAVLVETGLDALDRNRVQEVVVKIIVARPLHLHRRTDRLGKQCRLERKIALRFASETAAEQRDIDGHVLRGDSQGLCDVFPRPAGTLHRRPDLGLAVLDVGDRDRCFHARMREVRQVVFADDHLVGAFQRGLDVAFLAHDQARLARGLFEFGPIGDRIVLAVGAVIPHDLQRVAPLDGRAGIARDHRDAAERLKLGRPRPTLHLHDLLDAGDFHRCGRIERLELAARDGRPRDHRILHAGKTGIAAIRRGADGNIAKVDDADLTLAKIAKVLRVL